MLPAKAGVLKPALAGSLASGGVFVCSPMEKSRFGTIPPSRQAAPPPFTQGRLSDTATRTKKAFSDFMPPAKVWISGAFFCIREPPGHSDSDEKGFCGFHATRESLDFGSLPCVKGGGPRKRAGGIVFPFRILPIQNVEEDVARKGGRVQTGLARSLVTCDGDEKQNNRTWAIQSPRRGPLASGVGLVRICSGAWAIQTARMGGRRRRCCPRRRAC